MDNNSTTISQHLSGLEWWCGEKTLYLSRFTSWQKLSIHTMAFALLEKDSSSSLLLIWEWDVGLCFDLPIL
jgi:hypothetical protein